MRRAIQRNLSNALWGVLDYAAWPIGILLLAPILLRQLGVARFGIWAVAMAAINAGAILASGFGDANIQQVATHRGQKNLATLIETVRTSMGIHLTLGAALGVLAWSAAPLLASRIVPADTALRADCLRALRVASFIILARAMETVCISTQRGFERYGAALYLSVAGRIAAMIAAAALAWAHRSITDILLANAALLALSLLLQIRSLRALLHTDSLRPVVNRDCLRALLAFGVFSWIQAASSVVVGQSDRLFTGAAMGAAAVAAYALCVQITQPLYGIASSGLHFLFPHLASQAATAEPGTLRRPITRALVANAALVAAGTLLLACGGRWMLALLGGPQITAAAAPLLPLILCGTALLALTVTPYYVLLAVGQVKVVAAISLAASALMLFSMTALAPLRGVQGVVLARLLYALIAVFLYLPLLRYLFPNAGTPIPSHFRRTEYAVAPTQINRSDRQNRTLNDGSL